MVNPYWVEKYGRPPPRPTPDSEILTQVRGDANGPDFVDMLLTRGWPVEGVRLSALCIHDPSHAITPTDVRVYRDNPAIDGSRRVPCHRCGRPAQIVDPTFIYADDEPPRRVVRLELLTAAVTTISALSADDLTALTDLARRVESGDLSRDQLRSEINRNSRLRRAFSGWSRTELIALMTMLIALAAFIVSLQVINGADGGTYLTPQQFQQLITQVSTGSSGGRELSPIVPPPTRSSRSSSTRPETPQPTNLPTPRRQSAEEGPRR